MKTTIKRRLGSLLVALTFILSATATGTAVQAENAEIQPVTLNVQSNGTQSTNVSDNNYTTRASTMASYVYQDTNGKLVRVEDIGYNILVETYSLDNKTVESEKLIEQELPKFGGFFRGDKYNFLVFGQENPIESDSCEVLRIVKYTRDWTRLDDCRIMGANTYIPFDAGSLRMIEQDGKLYIYTCHEMYASENDGRHHQASMTFKINQDTMNVEESLDYVWNIGGGYVSHSFNQFIQTDGTNIFRVDHGDAYPRGISITKFNKQDSIKDVTYTVPVIFSGAIGANYTGASIGGFELSGNNCIIAYNQDIGETNYRNIRVCITDKSFSSTKEVALTHYTASDYTSCHTPQLVKINNNLFLVLWEEENANNTHDVKVSAATLDGNGNVLSTISNMDMRLSDCQPILCQDQKVRWYATNYSSPVWYTINPYDLSGKSQLEITGVKIAGRASDALRVSWTKNAAAAGYIVEQYKSGKWVRIARIGSNATTTYRVEKLSPGTSYRFRVCCFGFNGNTAVYGNYMETSGKTNPSAMTGVKIGGKAGDALRINWTKNPTAAGYIIEQYKSGKWVRIARISGNSTTTYRVEKLSPWTTYKFRIKAFNYDGSTAIYGGYTNVSGKTNPSVVAGAKIGGRASDALRINWTKNSTAAGYIIEQYKSGKWVRIARIGSNATTTYRVEKLSPSTTYKFRIQSFNFEGDTPVYSSYAYVNGKTNPSAMTGVKIGGRASDALRINWTKNSTAAGYIIEQYKSGKWVRIARIGSNATTTYRVEKLSPFTTYKFRIQAFNFDGDTPVYGSYAYVSGKTNPSAMEGVKIGGRASDALRINWNRNTTAAGYIIEQYKSGKWVRIARIADSFITTYRVENLSPSTTCKFRVQAFNFDGDTPIYGSYIYVSGKTNPSAMTGVKIGGTAKDALRINWTKNSTAAGYIIDQYKNGSWIRIARITNNATTTYRVENLNSSTTYRLRIQAFNFDGSTVLYGSYAYVNGTTLK